MNGDVIERNPRSTGERERREGEEQWKEMERESGSERLITELRVLTT